MNNKTKSQNKRDKRQLHVGRCLCGSIRYTLDAAPNFSHYCCCDDCQRWSGAPAVAWVDFPQNALKLEDNRKYLKMFRSSPVSQRAFCSNCGSSIFAIDDDGKNMSATIVTLDKPNSCHPGSVSYISYAPRWFCVKALKKDNDT